MYWSLKRILDLFVCIFLLPVYLPVCLCISLAILIENSGPIFFKQVRVGQYGEPFTIYKFRTLYPRAHDMSDPLSVATPLGRFLRRWGLDELPQLWNVFIGDMSITGPRPTVPEQAAHFGAYERQRLSVRPGITGWAQIHGRNAIDWASRIDLDIEYIQNANLVMEMQILWKTPITLFSGIGTYGPNEINHSCISSSQNTP